MMNGPDNLRAAGLTVLAMALFSVSDVVVKLLTATYPAGQIMACRGAMCAVLLAAIVAARPGERLAGVVAAARDPACWLRALFEVGVAYCFFRALALLPIADATAVLFVFPVLLIAAAALVLRERVGPRRWAAVAAGLAGVLIILRPGAASGTDPAMIWPLAAAVCVAGRDLATRFVRPGAGSSSVALTTTLATTAAGLATLPFGGWEPVDGPGLLGFAAGAALVGAAFVALVEGTRLGDISFTAPVRYVIVPLAFAVGWAVWGHVPDLPVALGTVVIVGAGLVLVRSERDGGGPPAATADAAPRAGRACRA